MRVCKLSTAFLFATIVVCMGLVSSVLADKVDTPTKITFKYTGPAPVVRILAHESHGKNHVWFDGDVRLNREFTIDCLNGNMNHFTGGTTIEIFDPQGSLLQVVEMPTGKSDSLITGTTFGCLTLKGLSYDFKVPKDYAQFDPYLVMFKEQTDWASVEDFAYRWGLYGATVAMRLPLVNALLLNVPKYVSVEEMAQDGNVQVVEYDQFLGLKEFSYAQGNSFIRPLLQTPETIKDPQGYEYPWSVLKLFEQPYAYDPYSPIDFLYSNSVSEMIKLAQNQLKSRKLKIAFFDTGINEKHKTLGSLVKGGIDIVNPLVSGGKTKFKTGKAPDDNGHGTHVAGILSTILDKDYAWGKDAGVELYTVKVLDRQAMGRLSHILMGLQWAVDNEMNLINMSIGYRQASPTIAKAISETSRAGIVMIASVGNHSNYDDSSVLTGLADGGSADGGSADGGSADGGSADGGSADGGSADGGSADGGSADGGSADGGSADGGSADGGSADGGSADGGSADGGSADGGSADGGSADGGSADGGSADGGSADGGSADGGSADGGSADGGSADGGSADGGSADGGSADGGSGQTGVIQGLTETLPLYSVMYPARYSEVIAVGSSTRFGNLASFSNSGDQMDILAPGVNIVSMDITNGNPDEGFGYCSGTSMSAPYVTAAAALMLAIDPTLDAQQINAILKTTAHRSSSSAQAGDLNLKGALDEVMFRLVEQDWYALDKRAKEQAYRDKLKLKINSIGDKSWE